MTAAESHVVWHDRRIKPRNVQQSVFVAPRALELHEQRVTVIRTSFSLGPLDYFVYILGADNVVFEGGEDVLARLLGPANDAVVMRRDLGSIVRVAVG